MLKQILLVGIGGGTGSILRYLASYWISKNIPTSYFPLATFAVNISGCLLMGIFTGFSLKYLLFNNDLRYLLMAGFCGGYTTFSAFSAENIFLLEKGEFVTFATYLLVSIVLGLIAFYIGYQVTKN